VFDEEQAKCFPPKREGELEILLMPNAPKVLDYKVYPLMAEEWDTLHTFLTEEQKNMYIYPMLEHQYAPHLSEERLYLQGVRGSVSQTRAHPVSFVILLSFTYRH